MADRFFEFEDWANYEQLLCFQSETPIYKCVQVIYEPNPRSPRSYIEYGLPHESWDEIEDRLMHNYYKQRSNLHERSSWDRSRA